MARRIAQGYGDVPLEVPVASRFGRHLVEYLCDHDFDPAHVTHVQQPYGGKVARRYPTPDGELNSVRDTKMREVGLPHGFAFIVKRLFNNQPRPIVPVFQNTCYPPNTPSAKRSYQLGQAIGEAVRAWDEPARVAVVASGGLSHFVVDEDQDRKLLGALESKDAATLQSIPKSAAVLGDVGIAELDRRRRRDGKRAAAVRPGGLRARVSHAGQHRRRLGLRPLAIGDRPC